MMKQATVRPGAAWVFVLLAYGISWLIWSPAVLATYGLIASPLAPELLAALVLLVGAFGPLLAAVILTGRQAGRAGVRRLLARGWQWRTIGWPQWLVILGVPLAASAAARALDVATGGTPPPFALASPLLLLPTFLFILLLGGPIQEEYGWRGYLLPRLQARWGAIGASVVLGVIWALWHLPLWFMEGAGMAGTPLPIYLLYTLGETFLITWLFNRSEGSVLAAILMHTMANFVANIFPTHDALVRDSHAYLFLALIYTVVGVALVAADARRRVRLVTAAPQTG